MNGGNSTDDTRRSEETGRTGSILSATSEGNGILKTITIEIKVEPDDHVSLGSSTRSSLIVPKEWEDALPPNLNEAPSELLSMVVEQGQLAKARRS